MDGWMDGWGDCIDRRWFCFGLGNCSVEMLVVLLAIYVNSMECCINRARSSLSACSKDCSLGKKYKG